VPDTAFKLALDRLRNVVGNAPDASKDGGRNLAYALYVLARNGVAPLGIFAISPTPSCLTWHSDRQGSDRRGAGAARRPHPCRSRLQVALDDLNPPAQRSWSAVRITARRCATLRRSFTLASEAAAHGR